MSAEAASSSSISVISTLGADLYKESVESADPSADRCRDILRALSDDKNNKRMSIAVLDKTNIGKTVSKCLKALKRHRRSAMSSSSTGGSNGNGNDNVWEDTVIRCEGLLSSWKAAAQAEAVDTAKRKKKASAYRTAAASVSDDTGLPSSVSLYQSRLLRQKKELHKNPPVLPPPSIVVHEQGADRSDAVPTRHPKTHELVFVPGDDDDNNESLSTFRPNLSPEEILRGGAFGGTYYRPIVSAVTNVSYQSKDVIASSLHPAWIDGLNTATYLSSSTYRVQINRYRAKCGGSLGMWESSGWIADADPYGWFQWYCRFYQGRRTSDDARQISRWNKIAGDKGRFKSQLCNKILKADTTPGDEKISPVIRQTLWHWGIQITDVILERHRKRVSGK